MRRPGLLAVALALACGTRTAPMVRPPATAPAGARSGETELVERGAGLFQARGCAACHTIGAGTRVGPDLAGLAERRDPDWIAAMIRRPDSMLAGDPVAREVGSRYGATMPRLGIEAADARALAAFLAAPAAGEGSPGVEGSPTRGCGHARCRHHPPHGRGHRSAGL